MSPMKKIIEEFKWTAVGIIGKLLIDAICLTLKIEKVGWERVAPTFKSGKYIMSLWHSRLFVLSYVHKNSNVLVLVSQSKDGEIIKRILDRQGQEAMRGSSTRGGLRALAAMIKNLKTNQRPGAFTPDGPQGPRFIVKPGIITLAKKTGYPIMPMSYNAGKIKIFNSWDRFVLPMPFSSCTLVYGEPVYVPKDADEVLERACLDKVQEEMNRITELADTLYHHRIV